MLKKLSKIVLVLLISLYLLACAYLYFNQIALVYQPKPVNLQDSSGFEDQLVSFESDGLHLKGWLNYSNPNAPMIFYYGGSGEEVSNKLNLFPKMGIENYVLVNYRGYGDSEGSPDEQGIKRDNLKIYDEVVASLQINAEKIILYGNSLGTGVATYVAAHRPANKVILNTPYDAVVNVGQKRYPIMPVKLLSHQRFESIVLAPEIDIPVLCVIAEKDKIIPPQHAFNLCNAWKGKDTQVIIPEANHLNIMSFEQTLKTIHDYIHADSELSGL